MYQISANHTTEFFRNFSDRRIESFATREETTKTCEGQSHINHKLNGGGRKINLTYVVLRDLHE